MRKFFKVLLATLLLVGLTTGTAFGEFTTQIPPPASCTPSEWKVIHAGLDESDNPAINVGIIQAFKITFEAMVKQSLTPVCEIWFTRGVQISTTEAATQLVIVADGERYTIGWISYLFADASSEITGVQVGTFSWTRNHADLERTSA